MAKFVFFVAFGMAVILAASGSDAFANSSDTVSYVNPDTSPIPTCPTNPQQVLTYDGTSFKCVDNFMPLSCNPTYNFDVPPNTSTNIQSSKPLFLSGISAMGRAICNAYEIAPNFVCPTGQIMYSIDINGIPQCQFPQQVSASDCTAGGSPHAIRPDGSFMPSDCVMFKPLCGPHMVLKPVGWGGYGPPVCAFASEEFLVPLTDPSMTQTGGNSMAGSCASAGVEMTLNDGFITYTGECMRACDDFCVNFNPSVWWSMPGHVPNQWQTAAIMTNHNMENFNGGTLAGDWWTGGPLQPACLCMR